MKKLLSIAVLVFAFSLVAKAAPSDTTSLSLQIGAGSKYAGISVIDQVTGTAITPVTISNVVVQNNNPELATIIQNPSNPSGLKATPIAAGSGTALVTCHVVYTDPGDGLQKSEDKSILLSYTVSGTPHGVRLALTFN